MKTTEKRPSFWMKLGKLTKIINNLKEKTKLSRRKLTHLKDKNEG